MMIEIGSNVMFVLAIAIGMWSVVRIFGSLVLLWLNG